MFELVKIKLIKSFDTIDENITEYLSDNFLSDIIDDEFYDEIDENCKLSDIDDPIDEKQEYKKDNLFDKKQNDPENDQEKTFSKSSLSEQSKKS